LGGFFKQLLTGLGPEYVEHQSVIDDLKATLVEWGKMFKMGGTFDKMSLSDYI